MLTKKMSDLLEFLNERVKDGGIVPSYDEMAVALDLRSKSGIHRLVTSLEERGFVRRLPNRARALEIIAVPQRSVDVKRPRKASLIEAARMLTVEQLEAVLAEKRSALAA